MLISICVVQDGQLDCEFCPSALADSGNDSTNAFDPCTVLYHHVNHPANTAVLPPLLQAAHGIGAPAVRLLKLLAHQLYSPQLAQGEAAMIARGAFAYVQQRSLAGVHSDGSPALVAEKV